MTQKVIQIIVKNFMQSKDAVLDPEIKFLIDINTDDKKSMDDTIKSVTKTISVLLSSDIPAQTLATSILAHGCSEECDEVFSYMTREEVEDFIMMGLDMWENEEY